MSSVRMCDNCGAIFSESEDGWQTGTVATIGDDGVKRTMQQDRCPDCAVGGKSRRVRPRIDPGNALPALAAQVVNPMTGETPSETSDRMAAAAAMGQIVQENKIG